MGKLLALLEERSPLLQVALDLTRLGDALRIAWRLPLELGAIVLEAGTPLIIAEGMRAVEALAASGAPVLADTKAADVAGVVAETTARAGAWAFTVLGLAEDVVVEEAVRASQKHGVDVVVDLIGSSEALRRIEELASLGVRIVELHVGIDAQRRLGVTAETLAPLVAQAKKRFDVYVAVAGGIRPGAAGRLVAAGADIVVVGGAITRSGDPRKAAETLVSEIRGGATSSSGGAGAL